MEAEALDVFLHLKHLKNLQYIAGAIRPEYFSNMAGLFNISEESNQLSGPLPKSFYELARRIGKSCCTYCY